MSLPSVGVSAFANLIPLQMLVDSIDPAAETPEEGRRSDWDPLEGVNVDPGATVVIQSQITNTGASPLSGTLVLQTKRDLTTTSLPQTQQLEAITITPGETVIKDLTITASSDPGVYQLFLTIQNSNGEQISAIGEYRLVVRGASASIVSVTADELRLSKGETARFTIHAVGSADRTTSVAGSLELILLDEDTSVGSVEASVELRSEVETIRGQIVLNQDIVGTPKARITLKDNSGNVLDVYEVEFSRHIVSKTSTTSSKTMPVVIIAAIAVLLLGILLFIIMRLKRGGIPPSHMTAILVLIIVLTSGTFVAVYSGQASHEDGQYYGDAVGKAGIGNSLSILRKFGKHDYGIDVTVTSPLHNSLSPLAPGTTVKYKAKATYYACSNKSRPTYWDVYLAEPFGGWISDHDDGQFVKRLSLPEQGVGKKLYRTLTGNIPISSDPSYYNDNKTTVMSDLRLQNTDGTLRSVAVLYSWQNVSPLPPTQADLSLTKTGPTSIEKGQDVTYTVSVTNLGPNTATNVVVKDVVPAGLTFKVLGSSAGCTRAGSIVTCAIPTITASQTIPLTLIFTTTVPAGTCTNSSLTNTASVTSSNPDPVATNNSSSITTTLTCPSVPTPTPTPVAVLNQTPIAVAKISINGSTPSSTVTVQRHTKVQVSLSANDSSDPDGWITALKGVSQGGKCEWNSDLNQGTPTFETIIQNPASPASCNTNAVPFTTTFNDTPGTYTYQLLKITDAAGAVSNSGTATVIVTAGSTPTPSPTVIPTVIPTATPTTPSSGSGFGGFRETR